MLIYCDLLAKKILLNLYHLRLNNYSISIVLRDVTTICQNNGAGDMVKLSENI